MSPYAVFLYHQEECLPKTGIPVLQAFSYYISTETELVLELILVERDTEKILHLMIQAWNFHHIFITSHAFKNDSWPLQIRPFSRWPPKNKMADISSGSVFGKIVISQFPVIVEHQIWYQIKATALSLSIKFKYANKLICIFMNINKFYFYGQIIGRIHLS